MWLNDIDKMERLPKRLGMPFYLNGRDETIRQFNRRGRYSETHYSKMYRLLKRCIGKPIKEVYDCIKRNVPNHDDSFNHHFWDFFVEDVRRENGYTGFYIEEGIVKLSSYRATKEHDIVLVFDDYKTEYYNILTGLSVPSETFARFLKLEAYYLIYQRIGLEQDYKDPIRLSCKPPAWYTNPKVYQEEKEKYESVIKRRREAVAKYLYNWPVLNYYLRNVQFSPYWDRYSLFEYDLLCKEFPLGIGKRTIGSKTILKSGTKEYKQYRANQLQSNKRDKVYRKKEQKLRQYCFLTDTELQRQLDKQNDIITRDRFGFDETSFKGEHYHGQKRKKQI